VANEERATTNDFCSLPSHALVVDPMSWSRPLKCDTEPITYDHHALPILGNSVQGGIDHPPIDVVPNRSQAIQYGLESTSVFMSDNPDNVLEDKPLGLKVCDGEDVVFY
jgi:hypothetical protein